MEFSYYRPCRLESYQLYFFTMLFFNGKTRPVRGFSYQLYFDTTTHVGGQLSLKLDKIDLNYAIKILN